MDAVEPEILERVETAVTSQPEVHSLNRLRLRWVGHHLQGDVRLSLHPLADGSAVKQDLRTTIRQTEPKLTDLTIEIEASADSLDSN